MTKLARAEAKRQRKALKGTGDLLYNQQKRDIEKLAAERDDAREDAWSARCAKEDAQKERDTLKAKLKIAVEALEFYGHEGWNVITPDGYPILMEINRDGGKRAREALAKIGGGG